MEDCCKKNGPCGEGEGDCEGDNDECAGDLICGQNNCGPKFKWAGADCCMKKSGNFLKNAN